MDSIRKMFTEKQVVIIPSENKAFVSKILGSIGGMDSTSLVFGLSDWKKYDNLDINNLMFLDVLFPDPHYYSNSSKHDISFINLFLINEGILLNTFQIVFPSQLTFNYYRYNIIKQHLPAFHLLWYFLELLYQFKNLEVAMLLEWA